MYRSITSTIKQFWPCLPILPIACVTLLLGVAKIKIFKFENLKELNFDLPYYNKNNMEKDWESYYNDELKEIVNIFYQEDFKKFNY